MKTLTWYDNDSVAAALVNAHQRQRPILLDLWDTVHMWHPHFVLFDDRLKEVRRFVGYLPPTTFMTQITVGVGLLHLYHRRFSQAHTLLNAVRTSGAPSNLAAEAMYWEGVAAYRIHRSIDALRSVWGELRAAFADTDWAERADCLNVSIPDEGFDLHDPTTIRILECDAALRALEVSANSVS